MWYQEWSVHLAEYNRKVSLAKLRDDLEKLKTITRHINKSLRLTGRHLGTSSFNHLSYFTCSHARAAGDILSTHRERRHTLRRKSPDLGSEPWTLLLSGTTVRDHYVFGKK